jgi:acetolactate synthase-1/2/3 large subunit
MMRVADYIARRIAEAGVRHVFMITGGGAMHLNDALGRVAGLQYICNHHEQACAMAADGYARITGNLGVCCVTTGPGGTNTITGVLGQWLDSVPALYVSGQVRTDVTVASTGLPLRQLGDQEADIVAMVESITKYAVLVTDPLSVRYHFEKAVHLARTGRPGPVWLDIPLNVQATMIDEADLTPYDPREDAVEFDLTKIEAQVAELIGRVRAAERPVLLAGAGVRLGNAYDGLQRVADKLNIPVLTAWDAIDLMASDHPLFFGRPSTLGQRPANFIFQNADLLLSVGCRLNVRQIGYTFDSVARAAYKAVVDIDPVELKKKTLVPDMPIHADAKVFFEILERQLGDESLASKTDWLAWCAERVRRYPVVLEEYRAETEHVNPYVFCDVLADHLAAEDVVVSSDGSSCVIPIQALRMQRGQRYVVNSGCASMGFGLPAAIGACFAHGRRTICLEGDGSIQLNIQELQTVVHHKLPLKIFVFNNDGYLSIRTTQKSFFNENYVGEGARSGVSFPDLTKLAEAYGIKSVRIHNHAELGEKLAEVLSSPGPVLCDVIMTPEQMFSPRVSSQKLPDGRMVSKPLEDMFPFLERAEFLENMIIPEWEAAGQPAPVQPAKETEPEPMSQ